MSFDHISLPETTLKQFASQGSGKIFYIDITKRTIEEGFAATFNTKEDYYPKDIEKAISKYIETPLGRIRKLLNEFYSNKQEIVLPVDFKETLIKLMVAQTFRVPKFSDIVRDKSIFAEPLRLPSEFYNPLKGNEQTALKRMAICETKMIERFKSYIATVAVVDLPNEEFSLVLPTGHYFGVGYNIFFVISPCRAILLMPQDEIPKELITESLLPYQRIHTSEQIMIINKCAIRTEKNMGSGRLVGLRPQLEKLIEFI